jgi:hypothetical protein
MQRFYASHGPPLAVCMRLAAISFGVIKPPKQKPKADEPDFEQFMTAIAPGGNG